MLSCDGYKAAVVREHRGYAPTFRCIEEGLISISRSNLDECIAPAKPALMERADQEKARGNCRLRGDWDCHEAPITTAGELSHLQANYPAQGLAG